MAHLDEVSEEGAGRRRKPKAADARVPSDEVYRRFAEYRSELAKRTDLTADELRAMLVSLLEASEMLVQSLDDYERLLVKMLSVREASSAA